MRFRIVLPLLLAASATAEAAGPAEAAPRVAPEVRARLATGESVPVLVALARRGKPLDEITGFELRRCFVSAPVVAGRISPGGLSALLARSDVAAISLDGVVHPAGQLGTAQVGADRLAALGVTGKGRRVAVIDTGLDVTHPDLHGPFPGWNFAEKNDDLSDCDGHGTAVAGVLAGPQGMAPEAGLAVLKVFSARDGCRSANYSDVLAAVDWAVEKRDLYDIDAINLSLADEVPRRGFCDAEDAASSAVFGAARQAGIAVVAASGNDGKTTGLPWPGCLSEVAAVGMVYSASVGHTEWGGTASCEDTITGADVVPCASNSGPGLSFLAPGFDWATISVGGGRLASFSGTSASAPAATGAIVLARQSRLLADPVRAFDLLRATGVPVVDRRNARATPRLDLSAAFDAAAPAAGRCATDVIPDGDPAGLACEAVASSVVGRISSVAVALSIDHPDPTQLAVTLTSPDGISVRLMDGSGAPGDAFREVFGRTSPAIEPLSSFVGHEAAGVWRLKAVDRMPGGTGRIVSWAVAIELEAVDAPPPAGEWNAVLPTSARVPGRFGAFFTTDLQLFNADPRSAATVSLRFVPSGGAPSRALTLALTPLSTRSLDDLLGDGLRAGGFGPVFLSLPRGVFASSRTFTTAPRGGTYALAVPALVPDAAVGRGGSAVLIPLLPREGFRLNVGLTEIGGAGATARVTVRDGSGARRGDLVTRVPPGGLTQVNDVYAAAGLLPDENDRLEVRVIEGLGRVIAFATLLENGTNGGAFTAAAAPLVEAFVPLVAHGAGPDGSLLTSDLKVANLGASPVMVRIAYAPAIGPVFEPVLLSLAARETRLVPDILGTLFSARDEASGALHLTVLEGGAIAVSSRTSREANGRTHGFGVDALPPRSEAPPGRQLALLFLARSPTIRTGAGFLERTGTPTRARVTLYSAGGEAIATKEVALGPSGALQWDDLFDALEAPPSEGASALVEVLEGGTLSAYSLRSDVRTGDTTLFPAAVVP